MEDLLTPVTLNTDPVIFDPCGFEFNAQSGIYVYKLDMNDIDMVDIQVWVSDWNVPYGRCLRHEKTDIQELLLNKS